MDIRLVLKQFVLCCSAVCLLMVSATTHAYSPPQFNNLNFHKLPTSRPLVIPQPPELEAKSYMLVDYDSGTILAEKNPKEHVGPASITKLMTLYIAFNYLKSGQIKIDDKVLISKKAWRTGGSRMFLQVKTEVPIKDLIEGVIVASGNDACVALAEYIAGSEDSFVSLMNEQAKVLGLTDTHYTDATGMPHPEHYTTAKDIAILIRAIIQDFPNYYPMFAQRKLWHNGVEQVNRNRLLWDYKLADGLKTGHTKDAGYCLAASALQDNHRLISVIMGSGSVQDRTKGIVGLFTYGFRFFETHKIYARHEEITQSKVWMGQTAKVPLGLNRDLFITIPKGAYRDLSASVELPDNLKAPIREGTVYGTLNVTLGKAQLASRPLVALSNTKESNSWDRLKDYIGLSVQDFFKKKSSESMQ